MNLYNRVQAAAREFPRKEVLHGPNENWTYEQLFLGADQLSKIVNQRVSGENERVGILLPELTSFASCFFGILRAGCIPVPLNVLATSRELSYFLEDSSISEVLTTKKLAKKHEEMNQERFLYIESLLHERQHAVEADENSGKQLLEEDQNFSNVSKNDPLMVLYTTGSTARPKGVVLTHQNLLSNIEGSESVLRVSPDDTFLSFLPLFHTFSINCSFLLPLSVGCTTKVYPRFSPGMALDQMQEGEVSVFLAVPAQYRAMAKKAQARDDFPLTSQQREERGIRCLAGGEKLPEDIRQSFRESVGLQIYQGYGLTETSPVISVNTPEQHRAGSVGKPLPNVQCRIAERQEIESVDADEDRGEIQVKAPSVMKSYLQRPEQNENSFTEDGWFRTGDVGYLDSEGFLYVTGRIKELIISAGENIAPAEIEEILLEHPDVANAAVVGKPDERKGEVPVAFIQVDTERDESTMRGSLRDRVNEKLPPVKRPREFIFLQEFPMTSTGKVQKSVLQEQVAQA